MKKGKARSRSAKRENFLYMKGTPALSWRLDPDESLSDFTLRISSSEHPKEHLGANRFAHHGVSNQSSHVVSNSSREAYVHNPIKTYFVHRTVLAVGPRSSEYFAQLFKKGTQDILQQQQLREEMNDGRDERDTLRNSSTTNVAKIELLPSAASCFPILLDYLYAPPGTPLPIKSTNASALRHLASSFGIKSLFHETTDFIKKDLTPETAPVYLLEGRKFKNTKIASTAVKTIAANFQNVKMTALSSLPSDYMMDIVKSEHLKVPDVDRFSTKIASYCRCRGDEITLNILEALTPPELMPTIVEEESLYFLELFLSLGGREEVDEKGLFKRCLEQAPALLKKVRSGEMVDPNTICKAMHRQVANCKEIYKKLPDRIKVQILEKIPTSSNEHMDSRHHVPEHALDKKKSTVSKKEKKAKKEAMKIRNEMEEMKIMHEKKIEYLKQKLGRKDEELIAAKKSLKRDKYTSFESPVARSGCFEILK